MVVTGICPSLQNEYASFENQLFLLNIVYRKNPVVSHRLIDFQIFVRGFGWAYKRRLWEARWPNG